MKSIFILQHSTICEFDNSGSWVILSPIEQSIKQKIEAVGTPLKDWDIQINYGIKTGFNDAFIISTEKRDEILANCATDEERTKTAELIRPILRGRDIKRYGYEWAELWLVATFPSRHYDIEEYPALKNHLLSFGIERLEQTGKKYDGFSARKKTNNKWFETQDSISYWEDFLKPKIVWKRVGSILRFSFDDNGCLALDSTCFATGKHIKFLVALLNSKFGNYLLKDAPKTGTGDLLISVQAVEPIKIPSPSAKDETIIEALLDRVIMNDYYAEKEIDKKVYELYGLNQEEIDFIESL